MITTLDLGDEDIHPRRKREVGRRLSLAARNLAYGEPVVYSGPIFSRAELSGSKAKVFFNSVGSGLQASGPELVGFFLADDNAKWHSARARIEGHTVIVEADDITRARAVRYAWARRPVANLSNREGFPASPF